MKFLRLAVITFAVCAATLLAWLLLAGLVYTMILVVQW